MTHRLDPLQLEQVWDARVLGDPIPLPIDDAAEWRLFELLDDIETSVASPHFVRALERQLALGPAHQTVSPAPDRFPTRTPPATRDAQRSMSRPLARGWPSAVAIAAVALLVILSAAAIALPRPSSENERSIPAVSIWEGDGPSTSAGVETTPLFSHTFSAEELANFSMDQWGWMDLVRGAAGPGARSVREPGTVNTSDIPGINVITVISGQVNARLVNAAVVYRQNGAITETITGPAEIAVGAGDTLVFDAGTLSELWNQTDADTTYIAGGLYTRPANHIFFTGERSNTLPQGISIQASMFAGASSLELSTDRVVVGPGQTFAYSITPQTLFLASVVGDGLEKQEWANGERQGNARTLVPSSYSFHQDGPGYYTLTNTGSEPVEISLFKVDPTQLESTTAGPTATAETLFSRTLDIDQLAQFASGDWQWIGITRGTIAPGQQSVIVDGSPVAYDPDYAGLGTITVEQGSLQASVDAGAWIQRSGSGEIELIEGRITVTLEAGDTLFVPPSSLPAFWNPGEFDAIYVAGGVYTSGSTYPVNAIHTNSTEGGIRVNPNDLAIGTPLTMSLEHVAIEPDATYSYPVSSETWLMAMVTGDGLTKQKQIEGGTYGNAQTLVPSTYSLHQDGFGTYVLTNSGSETVDIYFYRVEPLTEPMPRATTIADASVLLDATLSPEQLLDYRFDDWRWIQFNRNSVSPQGDSTGFAPLLLPGWNVVPGLNLMAIESGELIVEPASEVLVARGVSGRYERVPGGSEITLAAGDSLLYSSGTEGRYWNPTDVDTMVVGGGGYLRPESPAFGATNAVWRLPGQFGNGLTVDSADMPEDVPVSISIERVSITSGGSTTIDLGAGSWVLAAVERGDLAQTTFLQGEQVGEVVSVRQGEVTLKPEAGKTVELRNVGSGKAVIYVMTFEPVGSDEVA